LGSLGAVKGAAFHPEEPMTPGNGANGAQTAFGSILPRLQSFLSSDFVFPSVMDPQWKRHSGGRGGVGVSGAVTHISRQHKQAIT
jgi:hypothetical protein